MLGKLLRRLTGQEDARAERVAAVPPAEDAAGVAALDTSVGSPAGEDGAIQGTMAGSDGAGPVFSSRAVRDAKVVTATLDVVGRFVAGQDVVDELTRRLETLTADQMNFLQLSAEPGVLSRAQTRAEEIKGTKGAALRKRLGDLAGGALPDGARSANPLSAPRGLSLPPLAALARPAPTTMLSGLASTAATSGAPGGPAPVPPGMPSRFAPAPSAPSAVVAPTTMTIPLRPRQPATGTSSPGPAAPAGADTAPPAPEPVNVVLSAAEPAPPIPPPPPAAKHDTPGSLPRLARGDAESRRARLMATLNDHLSSSEAAP